MKSTQILQAFGLTKNKENTAYCSKLANIFDLCKELIKLPGFFVIVSDIIGNLQFKNSIPVVVKRDSESHDWFRDRERAQERANKFIGEFSQWQTFTITTNTGNYKFNIPINNDFYFALCDLLNIATVKAVDVVEQPLHTITVNSGILADIAKAIPFLSGDDLRPAMQSVCLHIENKTIQVVATDAHRLYYSKLWPCEFTETIDVLIADKSAKELVKLKVKDQSIDIVVLPENKAIIAGHKVKLIDARYPAYKVVIPEFDQFMTFERKAMINAINIVKPHANKSTCQVNFHLNGNIALHTQDVDFSTEANTEIPYSEKTCPDTDIAFNGNFLIEGLKTFKEKSVKMYTAGRSTSAAIFSNDVDNVLIMPLMLNH